MLKKEFKDAGKTFFYYCGFSIALAGLAYLTIKLTVDSGTTSLDIVEILIHPFMLLLAFALGVSFFLREKFEGTLEYLLSLPLSRKQLIFHKILPRLLFLLATLSLYAIIIVPLAGFRQYVSFPSFACIYISVFFIGISLSLNRRKGVATVFQSAFFFIFSSALFLLFTYLAVYWQFSIKDQTAYFKQESIFAKVLRDEPLTILAAFVAFSLVLFIMFVFRFKRTDLRNQGKMPLTKYIRFVPLFALIFLMGFFLDEYQPTGTKPPIFRYKFAGGRLLQENGYDVFIHDQYGRHQIKLDLSNQKCGLFIQQTPGGDRCFLWDELALYRLDPKSYNPQSMYSMNSNDTELFIKKSGNRVYLGESGWKRTTRNQFMHTSRLVTIDLDSGKHTATDADFIDANPLFIYSADSNQRWILSEIRAFKDDRINTIDLRNRSLQKIDMHTKVAIASIKKKFPDLSDPKLSQFRPVGRTELLIGLESIKTHNVSIFRLNEKGVFSPMLANQVERPELIHEYVYQETRLGSSPIEAVIIKWDYKNQVHRLFFNEFKSEKERYLESDRFIGKTDFVRFIRSEENIDVYLFFDDWSKSFDKIHDNTRKDIGRLPSTPDIGYKYFKSAEWNTIKLNVFTSGFGAVAMYSREYGDPDDSKVSFFRPFMPWIKNYIVKIFAFPDLKEIDFGKL